LARPVLIPSPFTGAGAWAALAPRLPRSLVVDLGALDEPDPYGDAAARIASAADGSAWIAVLHSGAGGFAPALAEASRDLAGFVFLDAVTPYPGRNWLDAAPPALAARLRGLVADGRLAPWNQWFGADPTEQLIPDRTIRAAFVAGLPRVPFAFLQARASGGDAWSRLPCAYVQLSGAYAAEADWAEGRGWTVRRASLHHLAMLSEPDSIAALIEGLPRRPGSEGLP
jgi:hypothetical protein